MLTFLKSLVGAGAMAASSTATGVTYLKAELRKAGTNPDSLPAQLYRDLAEHAQRCVIFGAFVVAFASSELFECAS